MKENQGTENLGTDGRTWGQTGEPGDRRENLGTDGRTWGQTGDIGTDGTFTSFFFKKRTNRRDPHRGENPLSRIPTLGNMMANVDGHDRRQPSLRKKITGMPARRDDLGWPYDSQIEEIIGVRPVCPHVPVPMFSPMFPGYVPSVPSSVPMFPAYYKRGCKSN